jgi:hypothetical protein
VAYFVGERVLHIVQVLFPLQSKFEIVRVEFDVRVENLAVVVVPGEGGQRDHARVMLVVDIIPRLLHKVEEVHIAPIGVETYVIACGRFGLIEVDIAAGHLLPLVKGLSNGLRQQLEIEPGRPVLVNRVVDTAIGPAQQISALGVHVHVGRGVDRRHKDSGNRNE